MRRTSSRHAGVTLVELIVFIVIVSVGLAGTLRVFQTVILHSADPMARKQVLAIAEATLEEILLKNFAPGGYAGPDRSQFDDIGDYAGYSQAGIKDVDGVTAIPGLENYTLSVAVTNPASLGTLATSPNVTMITVTVGGPTETIKLVGYRTNYETP